MSCLMSFNGGSVQTTATNCNSLAEPQPLRISCSNYRNWQLEHGQLSLTFRLLPAPLNHPRITVQLYIHVVVLALLAQLQLLGLVELARSVQIEMKSVTSIVWNILHLPLEYSAADRFLPEPCGGSNSKEKLQTTEKQNRKAKTEA